MSTQNRFINQLDFKSTRKDQSSLTAKIHTLTTNWAPVEPPRWTLTCFLTGTARERRAPEVVTQSDHIREIIHRLTIRRGEWKCWGVKRGREQSCSSNQGLPRSGQHLVKELHQNSKTSRGSGRGESRRSMILCLFRYRAQSTRTMVVFATASVATRETREQVTQKWILTKP